VDLHDYDKWTLGDLVQFGKVMKQMENEITRLKELRAAQSFSIRELQGHMLKGISSLLSNQMNHSAPFVHSRNKEGGNSPV